MYWAHGAVATYSVAAVVTGYCALMLRRARLRPFWLTWAFLSALCAFYAGAWGFVAFDSDLDRATWSEAITPTSTLFPLFVALPALVIVARGGFGRKT